MLGMEEWSTLTSTLLVGVTTLILVQCWRTYRFLTIFSRMGIPGPRALPLMGNMLPLTKSDTGGVFKSWSKDYGQIYGIYIPLPCLVVGDRELARDILVKRFHLFADRQEMPGFDTGVMKDSLLSIKGDHWKHVRGQLSPSFSSNKLKKIVPVISRVAKNFTEQLDVYSKNGDMKELRELCQCATLDIIAGTAFGVEVNSVKNQDEPFYKHAKDMMSGMQTRMMLSFFLPFLQFLLTLFKISLLPKRNTDYFVAILEAALEERRNDTKKYADFLQLLLEAEKAQKAGKDQGEVDAEIDFSQQLNTSSQWTSKGLTNSEMICNSVTFLFAGYQTVASVLSLTLFALAGHEDCLKKACEEVDENLKDGELSYDTAMNLPYVNMCMLEAMRLYFPLLLQRVAVEDVDLGGYRVTKGMQVAIPSVVFQVDPEVWPNPLVFNPENHSPEKQATRDQFAFTPFGFGPRNCIAMRLAQMEVRLMLAAILKDFVPVICEKSVFPPVFKPLSDISKDGLWVRFKRREDKQ